MNAWLALAASFVVMGGQFAVGKLGLQAGLSAYDLVALRFIFAAAALAPVLGWRGWKDAAGIGWGRALLLAVIAGSPYSLLMFGALNFVPAGHGAMIVPSTTLVMGTVLGAWWLGERHPPRRYVGAVIVLAGVVLIGAHSLGAASGGQKGDLMFLLAGLCWGSYTLLVKRWKVAPLAATAALSMASLLYLPVYFAALGPRLQLVPVGDLLLQGLYQGIAQSVLAMIGYAYAVKKLGSTPVSVGLATVPVIGTLIGMVLVGEMPAALTCAGLAAVSLGMLVANWPAARAPAQLNPTGNLQ
jgi:drug/metabolite transporter (DMT)-like permease